MVEKPEQEKTEYPDITREDIIKEILELREKYQQLLDTMIEFTKKLEEVFTSLRESDIEQA